MKIYKIPIYKINYQQMKFGNVEYVDNIIVKKNILGVSEILTEFNDIDVINSKTDIKDKKANLEIWDYKKYKEYGYHFIVFNDDLIPKNRINLKEIDEYLLKYDDSKWKEEYEKTKQLKKEEKLKINEKVKKIYGIKK